MAIMLGLVAGCDDSVEPAENPPAEIPFVDEVLVTNKADFLGFSPVDIDGHEMATDVDVGFETAGDGPVKIIVIFNTKLDETSVAFAVTTPEIWSLRRGALTVTCGADVFVNGDGEGGYFEGKAGSELDFMTPGVNAIVSDHYPTIYHAIGSQLPADTDCTVTLGPFLRSAGGSPILVARPIVFHTKKLHGPTGTTALVKSEKALP